MNSLTCGVWVGGMCSRHMYILSLYRDSITIHNGGVLGVAWVLGVVSVVVFLMHSPTSGGRVGVVERKSLTSFLSLCAVYLGTVSTFPPTAEEEDEESEEDDILRQGKKGKGKKGGS